MVSSLDGFIAKRDNSIAWFETSYNYDKGIEGEDPEEFLNTIDFDSIQTKKWVDEVSSQPKVGKIFIGPYLKTRLGLTSGKIRFYGCRAVRHDDHLHVQLN